MSSRVQSYIVMSTGVGMTIAFCFLLFGPQRRDLSALLVSARIMRQQLARGNAAVAQLSEIKSSVEQSNTLLVDYRTRITLAADVGSFVEQASAIAERLALRNRRITPMSPETHGPITALPIQISYESDFDGSFSFLREIESLPRAVHVTDLLVRRVDRDERRADSEPGVLRTELTMRIFYEST